MWRPICGAAGGIKGLNIELAKDPMLLEAGLCIPERPRGMELPSPQAPRQQEAQELMGNNMGAIHMDGLQTIDVKK